MTASSILAVLTVLIAMVPNNISAEVRFTSTNHAVFEGRVRIEGPARCSSRFSKGIEKRYDQLRGSRPWFEATAVLPCDLPDGGRVVIEVNGKPTGFQIPAGLIKHGMELYVGGGDIPYIIITFQFTGSIGKGIIEIEVYPQARNKRCRLFAYTDWPYDGGYYDRGFEGPIAYREFYVKEYLALRPLPCGVSE